MAHLICLSIYQLYGSASNVQLSDWLRQITWENELNLPQMYEILDIWGRFCTFEADSSNVQLSDWLRDRIGLKCTYIWGQIFKFLTFDTSSTSDISDVLKTKFFDENMGVSDPKKYYYGPKKLTILSGCMCQIHLYRIQHTTHLSPCICLIRLSD